MPLHYFLNLKFTPCISKHEAPVFCKSLASSKGLQKKSLVRRENHTNAPSTMYNYSCRRSDINVLKLLGSSGEGRS
jgi:hypothetical protein